MYITIVSCTWIYKSLEACAHELEGTIKHLCPRARPRVTSRSQEILIAVYDHFASEIEGGHLGMSRKDNANLSVTMKRLFVSLSLSHSLTLSLSLSFSFFFLFIYLSIRPFIYFILLTALSNFLFPYYLLIFLFVLLWPIAQYERKFPDDTISLVQISRGRISIFFLNYDKFLLCISKLARFYNYSLFFICD